MFCDQYIQQSIRNTVIENALINDAQEQQGAVLIALSAPKTRVFRGAGSLLLPTELRGHFVTDFSHRSSKYQQAQIMVELTVDAVLSFPSSKEDSVFLNLISDFLTKVA